MPEKKRIINKRGQLTIFIIIAILVVALAVLAYFLFPDLRSSISSQQQSPTEYMNTCMREKIVKTTKTIYSQGGSFETNSENSYFYQGDYIKYLCYTNEYWKPCKNQEPFLTEHVESEIENEIKASVNSCFESMSASYRKKGYDVELKNSDAEADVKIFPDRIAVNFENELTLTKGESQKYDSFYVILNSNIYELLEITRNIVVWEINAGDSFTEAYMSYDPYIKVEKKRKSDETKVYIVTDRRTEESFRFTIRSWALPPGYN